ncbi:uncharacterized protein K452DRAFT_151564 [Aplosporella prunicola CBS 121167]|uniref:Uncharacterized protein n=1 Tax=Aplosporella prunicola CBS 121167 TaxID=1176127 RepID=A0A6A6BIQ3_9PEZI|nr:uncharacterized protein K452DRAFT_151564 [Aplosporella prunicola CBS 121167]KAF2144020.1 hypothetical protein K452DRAFT_151564 [Aplosporella prunicola CBS 121167]
MRLSCLFPFYSFLCPRVPGRTFVRHVGKCLLCALVIVSSSVDEYLACLGKWEVYCFSRLSTWSVQTRGNVFLFEFSTWPA